MITDLTQGNPMKLLVKFSMPLLLSAMFQQMYNIADTVIAGKFIGENALAAVGASYSITLVFMAFAVGTNLGCSVVISQLFGAKKYNEMKEAVNTSFISITVLSIILTFIGFKFCNELMLLLETPDNIFADSEVYLGTYMVGLVFLFLYNIATGIFTALGDSRTPLYFLIGSSLGNIVLDLVFVICFNMGVAGVAAATLIAQGIAAVLAVTTVIKRVNTVKTTGKLRIFSGKMLWKILKMSVPSILQQLCVSIGNICVQGLVNSYGSSVIAGYSGAIKLNTFALTSFMSFSGGLATYTAQNVGAEKYERVKEGFKAAAKIVLCMACLFACVYFFFGGAAARIFLDKESVEATKTVVQFLKIISPAYFIILIKLLSDSVLRGAGVMILYTISTFIDLILRVVLAYMFSPVFGAQGIWMSWPAGWLIGAAISVFFYFMNMWIPKEKRAALKKYKENY